MTMEPDTSGWSHEQIMTWDAQQHIQTEARLGTERSHALALAEATKALDLAQEASRASEVAAMESNRSAEATARITAQNTQAATQQAFEHTSMTAWRKGRVGLIYAFVLVWLAMVGATLAGALVNPGIRAEIPGFIGLIGLVTGIAGAAAAVLYSQGYWQAQRGESGGHPQGRDDD